MNDNGLRVLASVGLAVCAASLSFCRFAIAAPDEELLGKSKGYPAGTRANWYTDDAVRVGSYTNLDKLFPNQYHVLHRAENPSALGKVTAEPSLRYRFGGHFNTIDDYLARQRVTGLLIIKDGQILVERYQYDRKPTDRLTSNSMAKSLISIGIGFALSDKLIHSLDDRVVEYVPELKGNIYGENEDSESASHGFRSTIHRRQREPELRCRQIRPATRQQGQHSRDPGVQYTRRPRRRALSLRVD